MDTLDWKYGIDSKTMDDKTRDIIAADYLSSLERLSKWKPRVDELRVKHAGNTWAVYNELSGEVLSWHIKQNGEEKPIAVQPTRICAPDSVIGPLLATRPVYSRKEPGTKDDSAPAVKRGKAAESRERSTSRANSDSSRRGSFSGSEASRSGASSRRSSGAHSAMDEDDDAVDNVDEDAVDNEPDETRKKFKLEVGQVFNKNDLRIRAQTAADDSAEYLTKLVVRTEGASKAMSISCPNVGEVPDHPGSCRFRIQADLVESQKGMEDRYKITASLPCHTGSCSIKFWRKHMKVEG